MAIQPVNVPVTLKGMSQKSPSNLSMPGEMTEASNVQVLKGSSQGVEFSKRYGTQSLPAAGGLSTNAKHLVTLGRSLVMDNDGFVLTRDLNNNWHGPSKNGLSWSSVSENISQSNYQKVCPAHAYDVASGNEIIAWYDEVGTPRVSIRGRAFGNWLAHELAISGFFPFAANLKVQVFAPGDGYFYLLGPGVVDGTMLIVGINATNPALPMRSATFAGDGTETPFDAQLTPEGNLVIAVTTPAAATTNVGVWNIANQVFTAINTIATVASAVPNTMWLSQNPFAAGGARRYYLATIDSTNGARIFTLNPDMSVASTVVSDAGNPSGNLVGYVNGGVPVLFTDAIFVGYGHGATIRSAGALWQRTVTLASRAFLSGGTWYCLTRYDSPIQPTLWLYDLTHRFTVGKVGLVGAQWSSLSTTYGQPPWVTQIGSLAIIAAQAGHESLGQSASNPIGTVIQGIALATFDGAPATSRPVELGGVLHYPGSIPWIYDGANAVESGFNLFPEWKVIPVTDTGSGLTHTTGATYGYRATYSWVDAAGNTYESAPSPIFSYLATSTSNVNVAVATYCLTSRTDVSLNLYRNDPQQPTVYRQVNSTNIPNDLTSDTVTILDNLPDLATGFADWTTRTLLYAGNGGAGQPFEHLPPPSCTVMATAQSRVFLAGVDQDPTAIWVSNEVVAGEGISYFDSKILFRITGAPTVIVGRDRNVVVFTNETIWTVTGEFPDNAGGSFATPTPFELPHAIGALSPDSVVVTSLGIFFQSKKGVHILGWDWSVSYIGDDIEDTLGSQTITGGIEVPALHQVRLYTATGTTFVWDTVFNLWTTFTGQNALAACNWRNGPVFIDATGAVWQETPGVYGDNGSFVESRLNFAIIAPGGLRGYSCLFALQLLGEIKGSHKLNASLAYNSQSFPTTFYGSAQAGSTVYGDSTYGVGTYGGAGDNVLKLEIRPKKRQQAAYELTVWDSLLSSGASQGFTLQAIVASIGVEGGLARTQASQRMIKG